MRQPFPGFVLQKVGGTFGDEVPPKPYVPMVSSQELQGEESLSIHDQPKIIERLGEVPFGVQVEQTIVGM